MAFFFLAFAGCDCEGKIRDARKASVDRKTVERTAPVIGQQQNREIEPNDSPGQATAIILGQDLRPMHGEIASAGDIDWFVLEPSETSSGLYELIVKPTDAALDVVLYL